MTKKQEAECEGAIFLDEYNTRTSLQADSFRVGYKAAIDRQEIKEEELMLEAYNKGYKARSKVTVELVASVRKLIEEANLSNEDEGDLAIVLDKLGGLDENIR